ncbi:histidine phosphatase family protein [Limnobacter alexandrii]|uniref:histidine phosphatase family protein n=1 Tax=Limnobacter alexandrii TaxID=2570352 RepID=UPI001109CCF7|nr:histidine phosphatase family protein [Limnobacter alexandrii]
MSTLVLMRHGQASFGAARYDALSEVGQAQARATGQWMKAHGVTPDKVFHGPRQRQAQSASLLLSEAGFNSPALENPALDEFAEGEEIFNAAEQFLGRSMALNAGRERIEILRDYDATCRAWGNGELEIPGRLSLVDFRERLGDWLNDCTSGQQASGQTQLVVTSAGSIAALVCEVMNLPNASWYSLLRVIRNASLTEVLYSKGKLSLLSFNGASHLPPHLSTSM